VRESEEGADEETSSCTVTEMYKLILAGQEEAKP
jgi:hypothetical protein